MRKGITYLLLLFLFCPLYNIGQNKIKNYEYWFDNNYAGKTSVGITPVTTLSLNDSIATTGINNGLHIFHIRFKDANSSYSSTLSQFFQKLPISSSITKQVVAYEYWFDNNYAGKVYQSVTAQSELQLIDSIHTQTLNEGLHVFHIRFMDKENSWSSVLSQFIQKVSVSNVLNNKINAYEYWFDNNYAGKVLQTVTAQSELQLIDSIHTQTLNEGLHVFHIRFMDKENSWSSVLSQFIQKVPVSNVLNNKINAYEYWFDNNYAGKVLQTVTAQSELQLIDSIHTQTLNDGLHVFHIRFMDKENSWSSVLSQFIQKVPVSNVLNNKINAYEYWFDNNYAGKVLQTVTAQSELQLIDSIHTQTLNDGLHVFHVRFKDANNSWSSVLSQFIQKLPFNSSVSNVITKYRYWFDEADSVMFNVQLPLHSNILLLNSPLNLSIIHKGIHIIHFQFLDSLTQWSCVTSDSMYKYPTIIAAFTPNQTIVCDSGLVNFTNRSSIDADTFKWIFDDGTTSDSINATHYFNTYGTHPIKLIAYDTTMGVKDTVVLNITVVHSPVVNLGNDTEVCPPGITLNAWYPQCTYLWSNSSTDSILNVSASGTYTVTVTNQYGCSITTKRTVTVNSNPVASATSNSAICAGHTLDLSSGSGTNYIYNWSGPNSFTSTNQYPSITSSTTSDAGTYTVTVTISTTGCSATAQTSVIINSNPVATASSNSAICAGHTLDLTLGGGNTYNWSGPNSFTNTNQDPSIINASTSASGVYTVTVTNNSTGCSSTANTSVVVNSVPVVNLGHDTTICTYNNITLNAGSGFSSYDWSTGQTNQTITVNTTGEYYVTVTNSHGCSDIDSIHVLTDPCTGIKDINGNDFVSIYPNPNNGLYYIKALNDFNEEVDIQITDLSGRILFLKENNLMLKDEVLPIDNENYASGIYMLYLTSKSARIIEKIVIDH